MAVLHAAWLAWLVHASRADSDQEDASSSLHQKFALRYLCPCWIAGIVPLRDSSERAAG